MGGITKGTRLVLALFIALLVVAISPTAAVTKVTAGTWSIVPSPSSSEPLNGLNSVTCVTDNDCWSVGAQQATNSEPPPSNHPLFEHWDGKAWSTVPNPGPTDNSVFTASVACPASNDCWAVGSTSNLQPPTPQNNQFFEHWDGSVWTNVSGPVLSDPSASIRLDSTTCVSGSDCWAVGSETDANNGVSGATLTEHWDGSAWSVVSSPNTSPSSIDGLRSVSCVTSADCWSVGQTLAGPSLDTLAEHWNGTAWTIVPTPNVTGADNSLAATTCVATNDCWSVGVSVSSSGFKTLFEHWDGTVWSIVASPNATLGDLQRFAFDHLRHHRQLLVRGRLQQQEDREDARRTLGRNELVDRPQC